MAHLAVTGVVQDSLIDMCEGLGKAWIRKSNPQVGIAEKQSTDYDNIQK